MQPNPRTENAKKDKVAVIFDAACAVIREKGFSPGTHHGHINGHEHLVRACLSLLQNKADLFDAIITEWWEGLFAMMDQCGNPSESVEQKLGSIVKYFLDQYEHRPDLVHIFITEISRSSANLTPERLEWFKVFMDRTEKIIAQAQAKKALRADVKARYLTYFFLGALESFVSAMVLENQPLKGSGPEGPNRKRTHGSFHERRSVALKAVRIGEELLVRSSSPNPSSRTSSLCRNPHFSCGK